MRQRMSIMIVIGLVVVATGSGCSRAHAGDGGGGSAASAGSATGTGIVRGHLYGVGGPPPGLPTAWPGTVTVSGSGLTRDLPVADDGAYSVTLAPGRYTVVGHSPRFGGGTYPCPAAHDAQVTAGTTSTLDVLCQMR
jgi:hypothetical protein